LTVGSFHISNVRAKQRFVSCGIVWEILGKAMACGTDALGYDANAAVSMVEEVLQEMGQGGWITRPPPAQDAIGLVLPPGSSLLQLRLERSNYFSFFSGDLQLGSRDSDAHYLLAAHFRIFIKKRLRSATAKQKRLARKKANRKAKKGGGTADQEEMQGADEEVEETRTVGAPSSDDEGSEELVNPWMWSEPPRPPPQALVWAAEQRRLRRRRGADRPQAPAASRPSPPAWEPEDAGPHDQGVWIDPWWFPPWRYYEQPSSQRRVDAMPELGCLSEV
jgi:hypothetical protein